MSEYNTGIFKDYDGLSRQEIAESRKRHGRNSFTEDKSPFLVRLIVEVVTEPMFILLLVACGIYLILGEWTEGMIMVVALILVSGISIYQTVRSKNATKALHVLSQARAKVIRDGQQTEVRQEDLVMADLIIVEEGDLIPSDAETLKCHDFSVNESILTGEAYPVIKNPETDNQISLGTQVVSGYALAKVSAIGDKTRVGKLGISMQQIKKAKTQLQRQIDRFVKSMALFGLVAFVIVWLINYISSGALYQSLLHGLTLAMSALPEEIPVAFSTFMALGAWRLIKKQVLTKQPQTVESLGAASVICLDKTGTITENKMKVEKIYVHQTSTLLDLDLCRDEASSQVLLDAMLASEVQPFDPMEIAIHEAYENQVSDDIRPFVNMYHEYPLAGRPPMMTHVYRYNNNETIVACKGGWEKIVKVCQVPDDQIRQLEMVVAQLAGAGMRILGTAHAISPSDPFPEKQEDFVWEFSGLIALSDPPKDNISRVFNQFKQAGIKIKMITGDYPETAMAIARQTGLGEGQKIYSGHQVMQMTDQEVSDAVGSTQIFARMFPEAKLKVINALKQLGEVVAMTGDGVNDGPALKAAEIGIAMGKKGTEIARQAADIILVDDNLEHMVEAIEAGRKIYYNLKKAFRYIISIHIPIIMVVTLPLLLGWKYPNIFSPIHVIFLELIMGPTCSIIYENEPVESHIMTQKPRKPAETLFSWRELSISIFQGMFITLAILLIYQWSVHQGHSENTVRTLAFTTLIFANIFLTLTNRSFDKSIFQTIKYKNPLIPIILLITVIVWLGSIYVGGLKALFQFDSINFSLILYCLLIGALAVFWIELVKVYVNRHATQLKVEID
ncbi:MAG: cation-translocating P-type ATPase [Saprospiraceae bacterium]|nr:cation-translocating P-type ATPase [Saprospiraceae bacterium]